jgi:hypothetical protein
MEQRMPTNLPGLTVATAKPKIACLKKITLLVFLLASVTSAEGQTAPLPNSKDTLSIRAQIEAEWARSDREAERRDLSFSERKADWARANRDVENGPKARPWDRDAEGNRPWDRKDAPPPKE